MPIAVYATHPSPPAGVVLRSHWSPNTWWIINDRIMLRGHIVAFVARRRLVHKAERFSADDVPSEIIHFRLDDDNDTTRSPQNHVSKRTFPDGMQHSQRTRGVFYDRCTFKGSIGLGLGVPGASASVVVCHRCRFLDCRDYAVYGSPDVFAMIGCRVFGGCMGDRLENNHTSSNGAYMGGHGIRFASGGVAVIQGSTIWPARGRGCMTAITFRGKGRGHDFHDGCVTGCITNNIITAEAQNSDPKYDEEIEEITIVGNVIRPWAGHPNNRGVILSCKSGTVGSNVIEANTGIYLRKKHGREPSEIHIRDNLVLGNDISRNQYMIEGGAKINVLTGGNTWKPVQPKNKHSEMWKGSEP